MTQVLACPAPYVIRPRADAPTSGTKPYHFRCVHPKTRAETLWQVQSLDALPGRPQALALEDMQAVMPAVLMALVIATGYRWLLKLLFNR